jgi:predicted AlkP superfamily pyrophosphatase or phosphodiesterase
VLLSRGKGNGQGVYSKLWTNGFLDSVHQGVQFSSGDDPVLFLNDPQGVKRADRRKMLDKIAALNEMNYAEFGDPEINAKIQQYEMAFRMQTAVPEVTDLSKEPDDIVKLYGPDCLVPGTYASNCLLARKLSENGVRFVQLYHQGWDQHGNLPSEMAHQAKDVDQASAALITDLKQRGMLDETLVIWGGEFGRTNYCQGKMSVDNYGRDHHPKAFSIWMAGGGVKPGMVYGETDEFGYNIVKDPVHVHDFQATLLHQLGIDHEKLTYKHLGRRFRLTDVSGTVVKDIIT